MWPFKKKGKEKKEESKQVRKVCCNCGPIYNEDNVIDPMYIPMAIVASGILDPPVQEDYSPPEPSQELNPGGGDFGGAGCSESFNSPTEDSTPDFSSSDNSDSGSSDSGGGD
jgi:hypothetical protein